LNAEGPASGELAAANLHSHSSPHPADSFFGQELYIGTNSTQVLALEHRDRPQLWGVQGAKAGVKRGPSFHRGVILRRHLPSGNWLALNAKPPARTLAHQHEHPAAVRKGGFLLLTRDRLRHVSRRRVNVFFFFCSGI